MVLLGILFIVIGIYLWVYNTKKEVIVKLRLEKMKAVNVLIFLEVLKDASKKDAYDHWDYKKYFSDDTYITLSPEDYVRKYLWFYNLPEQRIHYRAESFWDIPEHKKIYEKMKKTN